MATLRLLSKLAAVTLTTAALASGASHAESSKVAYELSDQCTKSARTFFTGLNYTSTALNGVSYEDHYNPTLNSCFLLVTKTASDTVKQVFYRQWEIWDVTKDRQLDMFRCDMSFKDMNDPTNQHFGCQMGDFARIPEARQINASIQRYMERE